MTNREFICVDFQKDFTAEGGRCYEPRPSVSFVKNTLIPYFKERNIRLSEIISDYRQPRPGDTGDNCRPGEEGYLSEIPPEVKKPEQWIKCMNSPIWVRENAGNPDKTPGLLYQNPEAFNRWLAATVGIPETNKEIILIGLTADCCVLCTAQELCFRGYKVRILKDAIDTYSGDRQEKEMILSNPPLTNWATAITWEELTSNLRSL